MYNIIPTFNTHNSMADTECTSWLQRYKSIYPKLSQRIQESTLGRL